MSTLPIPSGTRTDFTSVKTAIHRKLIQKLNLDRLTDVRREDVRREVSQILETLVVGEMTPMNLQERERLSMEILDEVFGLGPLEPLLADPSVSDILVNTYKRVYVERRGILEATNVQFRDDARRIVNAKLVPQPGPHWHEGEPRQRLEAPLLARLQQQRGQGRT